ncbi:MAG: carbohydrate porin, partial [Rhodocyclaceae bacterium]|nr:carbohydrate porin [Rhodocyclaceae bacterium]
MKLKPIVLAVALVVGAAGPAAANDDMKALLAEMKRLADRVEALEKQNKELEQSLASDRLSEKEPEIATRLKAVEFQTLSMQKQARQIEALEGISVGA